MATFGERVRQLRKLRGFRRQEDLADKVGATREAVGAWESKNVVPKRHTLRQLVAALGTTEDYLLGLDSSSTGNVRIIGQITLGGFAASDGEETIREVPMPHSALARQCFALEINDDSMAPAYRKGDLIFVEEEPRPLSECLGEDVLATLRDGRQILRRLMPGYVSGSYILAAYGAESATVDLTEARVVVGRTVRAARGG